MVHRKEPVLLAMYSVHQDPLFKLPKATSKHFFCVFHPKAIMILEDLQVTGSEKKVSTCVSKG